MNLLISGSSGFIGTHLVRHFKSAGYSVTPFELPVHDIRDARDVFNAMAFHPVDAILHLAALTGVTPSWENPQAYIDTNVKGSLNVLHAAAACHIPVILASSSSVYGTPNLSETDPCYPHTPYGVTKRSMEQFAELYAAQIPITVLRLFNVFASKGRRDMLPYLAFRAAYTGLPLTLRGDPNQSKRDWTHVSDVVQVFDLALQHMDGYQVYNIGTGFSVSLREFVRTVEEITEKPIALAYAPQLPGEALVTRADNRRAAQHLGWMPKMDFRSGMEEMGAWFAENEV